MSNETADDAQSKKEAYWLKNKMLITGLLLIWGISSFGLCIFLAEPLSQVSFFELPLSFWLAQQGVMVLFVILIFVYAWKMDELDDAYDVQEVIVTEEREEEVEKAKEKTSELFGDEEEGEHEEGPTSSGEGRA